MTTTTTTHTLDAIRDATRKETIDAVIELLNQLEHEYQDECRVAEKSGNSGLLVAHYAQIQALNTAAWRIYELRYRH